MSQQYTPPTGNPAGNPAGIYARGALPGPTFHHPEGDLTAVLMHMVDAGSLSATAARIIACERHDDAARNGAFYSRDCRPRVVWHGVELSAPVFSSVYAPPDEWDTRDIVPSTPLTQRLRTTADYSPPSDAAEWPKEWLHGWGPMDAPHTTLASRWRAVQRRGALALSVASPVLWFLAPVLLALAALAGLIWLGALGLDWAFHWLFGLVMAS